MEKIFLAFVFLALSVLAAVVLSSVVILPPHRVRERHRPVMAVTITGSSSVMPMAACNGSALTAATMMITFKQFYRWVMEAISWWDRVLRGREVDANFTDARRRPGRLPRAAL